MKKSTKPIGYDEDFALLAERVPHVANNLKTFWGSTYFHEYVDKLMFDTRDGKREGFPNEVAKAIYRIMKNHDELYPTCSKR